MLCGEDSKSYIISKDQSNPKRLKKIEKKVQKFFHFHGTTEFIIFLAWALFVCAFLLTLAN